jgi:subtilisin family serine protease
MFALDLLQLTALKARTRGSRVLQIGLIDGPVASQHPDLARAHLSQLGGDRPGRCIHADSIACMHGTFVAGMLSASPNSAAPAICPDCTLLVRPIFAERTTGRDLIPSASAPELAAAIHECIDAGARILNLSLGFARSSASGENALQQALDKALKHGVIVVAAAGNQGTVGSSTITGHPWVIPVVACDLAGRPLKESNLGSSIGRRGLTAPGDRITSLSSQGGSITLGGTSVAVPFVTGAIALVWSEFPDSTAADIKLAVTRTALPKRGSVVPPLLNAAAAFRFLSGTKAGYRVA